MKQHAAYLNLEIYEDSVNMMGVAKVGLPDINFKTVTVSGAGQSSRAPSRRPPQQIPPGNLWSTTTPPIRTGKPFGRSTSGP